MTHRFFAYSALLLLISHAHGQTASPGSVSDLVAQAVAANPSVAARRLQVLEAEAAAKSLGSPKNPELELAPGIGFTNSNFVLGQSFDLSGTRAARALRARAEIQVAKAGLRRAELAVGSETLAAYASYQTAKANEVNAASGVEIARGTVDAIRKRIEIGEAPAVQQTRAEIEMNRAEQALVLARNELDVARATLNSLLGRPSGSELPSVGWIELGELESLTVGVGGRRSETLEAFAHIGVARALELEARRAGTPDLFAGVTADTWSFDRRPFQRDNIGLQVRLTMPLFDRGENRFAARAAESARKAREAELKDAQRRVALDVESASSNLLASRAVAKTYDTGIIPKAEQMLKAMQSGLESGLTSFLEVLEAQRTLSQIRREASEATLNLHLAEVRFLTAVAQLPGLETIKL